MLGLDGKSTLSRVLDFILLFHRHLRDDSYSHPLLSFPPSPKLPPTPIYPLQPPALSFPAAMRVVQIMTCPKQCKGPLGKESRKDLLPFFTGTNVWIPFPLLLGPLLLLNFFFNDKINTSRKNKAFWLYIMLVVMWHLRAIMGKRPRLPPNPIVLLWSLEASWAVSPSLLRWWPGSWRRVEQDPAFWRQETWRCSLCSSCWKLPRVLCHLGRGGSLLAVRSSSHKSWIPLVL